MKNFTSPTQKTGQIGEGIACNYLISKDFRIIERNFTKKWGEIDIVAQKGNVTHFIEVKSVTRLNLDRVWLDEARPEDQMYGHKQKRLMRTIQSYLDMHSVALWQFDLLTVYMDMKRRRARVKSLPDLILS